MHIYIYIYICIYIYIYIQSRFKIMKCPSYSATSPEIPLGTATSALPPAAEDDSWGFSEMGCFACDAIEDNHICICIYLNVYICMYVNGTLW